MGFADSHELTVETRNMSYPRRSLLKMALEIGDARLRELGINVHVVVYEHVHCSDGEVFDGFVWPQPIAFDSVPGGLRFTLLSTSSELTLEAATARFEAQESAKAV